MKSCCAFLSLIICVLSACTYEPDGHYVNPNIHPPADQIPASIDIDRVAGDFALVGSTYFSVTIDRAGKTMRYFKVYKDGKAIDIIYSSVPDQFIFYVDPSDLNNGTHEYDIEAQLSSGSGSLAESYEYYLVQKKLVVTVDKSPPSAISGLAATMINGHMLLTWNKPAHKNYFYVVNKYNETTNYADAFIVNDANITEYVDEGFLGGKVSYTVTLQSQFFNVQSEPVSYDLNAVEAISTLDETNQLNLKWTVHSTFGDDVFIRISGRHFSKDFPASSGETKVDSLYLGDIAHATLKLLRKGFEEDGVTLFYSAAIGNKVKGFDRYTFLEHSNNLILHQYQSPYKTYRYNATTFVLEDSIYIPGFGGYDLLSSQNGNHHYLFSGSYLYSFNPTDFSQQPIQVYLNSIYWPLWHRDLERPSYYSLSNDNFLVLSNQHKIVTMDLNTKQLWGTEKNGTKAVISGDGNFMVITDVISQDDAVIYRRGSDDWEQIGKILYGEMFFSRLPNTQLISSTDGLTKVYDLNSTPNAGGYFSETASAPIQATGFDVVNDRVIQETIDTKFISTISIYSLSNFQLISTVRARVSNEYPANNHFIVGGRQLVTSGYIKNIE